MSSDDDYYDIHDTPYDRRRSSHRPRRRGSAQSRRHRKFDDGYRARASRRVKAWYFQDRPRVMAAFMFFFLLGYEVLILKGPLTIAGKERPANYPSSRPVGLTSAERSTTTSQQIPLEHNPLNPNTQPSRKHNDRVVKTSEKKIDQHPPISLDGGKTIAERVEAASKPKYSKPSADSPPYRPLKKHRRTGEKRDSVKVLKAKEPRPASALLLETRPADADDEGDPEDPDVSPKKASSRGTESSRPSRRDNNARKRDSDEDVDLNPPTARKHSKLGEGGAEPGAGENFWQWFQETKGSEKGPVSGSISCPEETERLCQMTYKYLRKYKIRTIFDASCANNGDWMPEVLRKSGNELWGFKYYCSVPKDEQLDYVKEKFASLNFVEYAPDVWWRDGYPDDTELLFAWDTLPHIAYGRVWNFFVKAKKQEIKYILVDNYPGMTNDPSPKRDYINLRKHPFRFPAAKEVVQNVTEPGENAKRQLLFYEGSMLPANLQ